MSILGSPVLFPQRKLFAQNCHQQRIVNKIQIDITNVKLIKDKIVINNVKLIKDKIVINNVNFNKRYKC